MMGRVYTAAFASQAETAQVDFFEIAAPSDMCVAIHAVFIGQDTEAGDAEDEQLTWAIKRGATTTGSGGNSTTINPLHKGDAASTCTVKDTNTTKAQDGTIATLHADVFNVRAGLQYIPLPEDRVIISPSDRVTVELTKTPADSVTWSGTIIFEEIGG